MSPTEVTTNEWIQNPLGTLLSLILGVVKIKKHNINNNNNNKKEQEEYEEELIVKISVMSMAWE